MRTFTSFVLAFALALAGAAALLAASHPDTRGSLSIGGRTRTWVVHAPKSLDALKPAALVIAMHGGGGRAEGMDRITGLSDVADKQGFLLVYPNGTGEVSSERLLTWNSGNCCGSAMNEHVDDIDFLRAMVRQLRENWKIDPHRIFATGISNGGMMAYRMACEMSDVVAGVAPVAAAMNVHPCKPVRPVSVIAFHGTADLHVLYEGGTPVRQVDRHPRTDMSVADAVEFWMGQDGCPHDPQRQTKGSIGRTIYSPCRENTGVEVVTIRGGGHAWPGGLKWAPWAEAPTKEISASRAMWDFFKAHTRSGAP